MSANFTPVIGDYKQVGPFHFWCQKVLPAVYDDSLSYYELLCKVVASLNDVITNTNQNTTDLRKLYEAYTLLQDWVNHYFDNLDIQTEVNARLDQLVSDGELLELVGVALERYLVVVNEAIERQDKKIDDSIKAQDDSVEAQNAHINAINKNVNVLTARMNTFASLPAGSTAGNAELVDIRVGATGHVYDTAGDAVREQLKGKVDGYKFLGIDGAIEEHGDLLFYGSNGLEGTELIDYIIEFADAYDDFIAIFRFREEYHPDTPYIYLTLSDVDRVGETVKFTGLGKDGLVRWITLDINADNVATWGVHYPDNALVVNVTEFNDVDMSGKTDIGVEEILAAVNANRPVYLHLNQRDEDERFNLQWCSSQSAVFCRYSPGDNFFETFVLDLSEDNSFRFYQK